MRDGDGAVEPRDGTVGGPPVKRPSAEAPRADAGGQERGERVELERGRLDRSAYPARIPPSAEARATARERNVAPEASHGARATGGERDPRRREIVQVNDPGQPAGSSRAPGQMPIRHVEPADAKRRPSPGRRPAADPRGCDPTSFDLDPPEPEAS